MTITNVSAIMNSNNIELKGTGSYYLPLMNTDSVEINYTLNGALTRKFTFNPYGTNDGGAEESNLAEILVGKWYTDEGYYLEFNTAGELLITDAATANDANEFEVYTYACNGETFSDWMGEYEVIEVTYVETPFSDLSFEIVKVFYDAATGEINVEYTDAYASGIMWFTKA